MRNLNEIKTTISELVIWQKANKRALKRSGMYGSFHLELTIQEAELILSILDENELGVLDSDSEQHGDLHAVAACNDPSSQSESKIQEDKQRSLPPITEAENIDYEKCSICKVNEATTGYDLLFCESCEEIYMKDS